MPYWLSAWLIAFLLTQVVETPIYTAVLGGSHRLLKALGASTITHPLLWFALPAIWPWGYWPMIAVGEVSVVAIEAVYLNFLGLRRAWLWSLVANGASLTAGLIYMLLRGEL